MTDIPEQLRAARFQGGLQQFVFAVEIGGAGQQAIRGQRPQGMGEEPVPAGRIVPIVLVADENEVEGRQFGHLVDGGGIPAAELQISAGKVPAFRCLLDGRGTKIHAQIKADLHRGQGTGQGTRFIGTATGEIQDRDLAETVEPQGDQCIAQQPLQTGDVTGRGGFLEWDSLDHPFTNVITHSRCRVCGKRSKGWTSSNR